MLQFTFWTLLALYVSYVLIKNVSAFWRLFFYDTESIDWDWLSIFATIGACVAILFMVVIDVICVGLAVSYLKGL